MPSRQTLVIVMLAALVIGSHVALREPTAPAAVSAPPEAGYYVIDGTLRGLSDNGDTLIEISARRAQQQPSQARVALEGVHVTYADREAVPWRLRADAGHISADWQLLELRGHVRIEGIDGGGLPLALLTDNLTVMVGARTAVTRSPVRLESLRGTITARGMTADLAAQQFDLEADVQGRFFADPGALL